MEVVLSRVPKASLFTEPGPVLRSDPINEGPHPPRHGEGSPVSLLGKLTGLSNTVKLITKRGCRRPRLGSNIVSDAIVNAN